MKVIFIGNDTSILTGANGDSRLRQIEYAKYFDSLIIIIFSLKKDNLKEEVIGNLRIIPTNSINRWLFISDTLKIIKNLHVDLISSQDPFIAGLAGVLAKFIFKIKLNIQVHNDFFGTPYFRNESLFNYIFYWLGKFNLLFADSVRVVSPRQKIGKNCFVAPVATDLDFFWGKRHIKIFNQIVTVARLSKQKNLPLFFDLAGHFPNLRFIVVGEGEERNRLEKMKPENVFFAGQKNRNEIKEIFSKSDFFVLTSNYEGWGLSCIEALAAGLPVIMPDIGCAGEAIVDGMTIEETQKLLREKYNQKDLMQQFINGLKNI